MKDLTSPYIGTNSRVKRPEESILTKNKGMFVPQTKISDKTPGLGEVCVVTDIVRDSEGVHQRWFFAIYDGDFCWEAMDGRRIPVHKDQYWIRECDCVPDLSEQVKFIERLGMEVPKDIPFDTTTKKQSDMDTIEMNWKVMREFIDTLEGRIEKLEERVEKLERAQYQPAQPSIPAPVWPYTPYTPPSPYYPYTDPLNPMGPVVTYDKTATPSVAKYTVTSTVESNPIQGVINDPDGSIK